MKVDTPIEDYSRTGFAVKDKNKQQHLVSEDYREAKSARGIKRICR